MVHLLRSSSRSQFVISVAWQQSNSSSMCRSESSPQSLMIVLSCAGTQFCLYNSGQLSGRDATSSHLTEAAAQWRGSESPATATAAPLLPKVPQSPFTAVQQRPSAALSPYTAAHRRYSCCAFTACTTSNNDKNTYICQHIPLGVYGTSLILPGRLILNLAVRMLHVQLMKVTPAVPLLHALHLLCFYCL